MPLHAFSFAVLPLLLSTMIILTHQLPMPATTDPLAQEVGEPWYSHFLGASGDARWVVLGTAAILRRIVAIS